MSWTSAIVPEGSSIEVGFADGETVGHEDVGANDDDGYAVGERLGGHAARLDHSFPKNLAG